MQRTYELMFIVRPDMLEEDQDKLISSLETQVGGAGGSVKSMERMGKRRLAYTVRKFQDGIYMLMVLEGEGTPRRQGPRQGTSGSSGVGGSRSRGGGRRSSRAGSGARAGFASGRIRAG